MTHDRDAGAARNILQDFASGSGHGTPAEGVPVRQGGEDVSSGVVLFRFIDPGRWPRTESVEYYDEDIQYEQTRMTDGADLVKIAAMPRGAGLARQLLTTWG